jgi:hypothetical protein
MLGRLPRHVRRSRPSVRTRLSARASQLCAAAASIPKMRVVSLVTFQVAYRLLLRISNHFISVIRHEAAIYRHRQARHVTQSGMFPYILEKRLARMRLRTRYSG